MLSRVAASLYWMGRYVERAEFTARLVEATVRLDALSSRPAGEAAWGSALRVLEAEACFAGSGERRTPRAVARFLTLDRSHPGSVVACLDRARDNAKAVRTALSREAWTSINRAWLLFQGRVSPGDTTQTLALVEQAQIEARGFEGALARMLRNPASFLIRLGAAIERADNAGRLLDVKYHLLLPEGEPVGGVLDRDQWTTILRTMGATNAYRWLYSQGLQPWLVAEMLICRPELPRSIIGSLEAAARQLDGLSVNTGQPGEADAAVARMRERLQATTIAEIVAFGLHEWLELALEEIAEVHGSIGRQFRFP